MAEQSPTKIALLSCTGIGLCLLIFYWITNDWFYSGDLAGFFVMFFIVCMVLLRTRLPKLYFSAVADVIVAAVFMPLALLVALFQAMYHGIYIAIFAAVYVVVFVDFYVGVVAFVAGTAGLLLRLWEGELTKRHKLRDTVTNRYYKLEALQGELLQATEQVERMTIVSERARIAREIHDNAGHEIVAAYMSLQTARDIFEDADPIALELYDDAMLRLDAGVSKIRESVHNLAPVADIGVEVLQKICVKSSRNIDFTIFGDTRHVPVFVWNVLESCLNEAITNVNKHATPQYIKVEVDATPQLVRLMVENDGAQSNVKGIGIGLRNLRQRLAAIGGNLSVTHGTTFSIVFLVPIRQQYNIKGQLT